MSENAITADSLICRSQSHVSTEIDGETVLLSIDRGNYYGMNKSLSAIWKWIEEPTRVSEIFRRMTETYEVEEETCERDVMKTLNELQGEGLIEVR